MEIEMSLDDIIQKKKKVNKNVNPRGRGGIRKGITRAQVGDKINSNFNNGSTLARKGNFRGNSIRGKPSDARLKIIQKNRAKLTDARDKLAEIAKQTDARIKLQKLRGKLPVRDALHDRTYSRNIGVGSLTLNTTRNGNLSLSTKARAAPPPTFGILRRAPRDRVVPFPERPAQSIADAVYDTDVTMEDGYIPEAPRSLKRSITNDLLSPEYIPSPTFKHVQIKRTVKNDMAMTGMPPLPDIRPRWEDMRSISPPLHQRPAPRRPENIKVHMNRTTLGSSSLRRTFATEDSPPPLARRMTRSEPFGGIHSRLDTMPVPIRTMGILSGPATPPSPPPGTRIVVSNLQPNVTQEDIKELFEDVGELLESRLVRPGTAEVIFKTLKDAQQAVEVYHNRQLDGQPMKCLLVNPRSSNKPTAPALRSSLPPARPTSLTRKTSSSTKSVVEPDIDTFHSVMFKRRD